MNQRSSPLTIEDFLAAIAQLSQGHRPYRNFCNFIEGCYCALAKQVALDARQAAAFEARYETVNDEYGRDPKVMERMTNLVGDLSQTLVRGTGDFLGRAYMVAEFGNTQTQQYFTEDGIGQCMSGVLFTRESVEQAIALEGGVHLLEPTAGSGGLVIAQAERLQMLGYELEEIMTAVLIDRDPLCVKMSFIQLSLKGYPGLCTRGETLKVQQYEMAYTAAAIRQWAYRPQLWVSREAALAARSAAAATTDDKMDS